MPGVLFVGREHEQDVYNKFLAREAPWVLIITGLGGIGKSTLQRRLAEYTSSESTLLKTGVITLDFANEELRNDPLKLLDKFTTDTAPFCDVQQIDSDFNEVLQQNINQLAQLSVERAQTGVSESEDPALREISHQMRELATEVFYTQIKTFSLNRLVIMLDTCEWLTEPEGSEVGLWVLNELVPGLHRRIRQQGRQCHVVMVSRVQLKLDVINGRDQQRLTLPMLGKAEVDQYLQHMGMQDADLRQRVFEVTHGLALCVSIIGDFWQQREAQKEPLTIADFPELKLQEFSEIALMQFTNERVLKQLKSPFNELTRYGVLLRSFDLPFLRNVFIELLTESEALDRFNQLIRYPYIESRGNYRYAFHELLREALAEETQKEEPEEWKGYHKRALDYLSQVSPHSPDWYYHLLAYDEKQGMIEWQRAIQEARESGKREFIGALLQAALDEALHLSPAAHAEVSYEQGRFNYYGVQWEEALKSYNEALAVFRQVEDYAGQAKVLQAIGDVQRTLGKKDDALASYEQALALFQKLGDLLGEARSCQAMGDVQRLRNDLDTALHCYKQCLDLFQQLKDRSEEAKALEAIGDVQRLRNDLDAALQSYEQALALYQEEKDRLKRAKVLKAMGDVQRLLQDRNAALESYGQALALFGELKEPVEEANVRRALEEIQQLEIEQGVLLESNEYVDLADRSSAVSTSTPTLSDSYEQPDEESPPTLLRPVQLLQISQASGAISVPPGSGIGEDEENISTVISGGYMAIQETSGYMAVQEKGTSINKRRVPSRRMIGALIGIALVIVAGSLPFVLLVLSVSQNTTTYVPPTYSPMFGFNPLHTHYNPDENTLSAANVSHLTIYWTTPTGSLINTSPVVANGVVYISSNDHYLYAFDATTGIILWKALNTTASSDRGNFIWSTPAVVNGVVYIGSTDHNLYAFKAAGCGGQPICTPLWMAPTGGAIFSSPTVVNGVVYIGSDDGKLYAFDATMGKIKWTASTGGYIVSSPAVVNGVVYVGSWDHKLYAFDSNTGSTLWTASTAGKISSSPAVVNGAVYVGSEDGNLYTYNASGCGQGQTVCQPLWIAPTGAVINSSPAVANGRVYIGSQDGKLYASECGITSCLPIWAVPTRGQIESSPAVANGVVYVGSSDSKLYAFDASTGKQLWSYKTGDGIFSSPTVINGVVYIGSSDHKLYAFHLPGAS